jgi:hypothetical protein
VRSKQPPSADEVDPHNQSTGEFELLDEQRFLDTDTLGEEYGVGGATQCETASSDERRQPVDGHDSLDATDSWLPDEGHTGVTK